MHTSLTYLVLSEDGSAVVTTLQLPLILAAASSRQDVQSRLLDAFLLIGHEPTREQLAEATNAVLSGVQWPNSTARAVAGE